MPSRDFVQCLARLAEDRGNAVALTVVSQPAGAEAREEVFGVAYACVRRSFVGEVDLADKFGQGAGCAGDLHASQRVDANFVWRAWLAALAREEMGSRPEQVFGRRCTMPHGGRQMSGVGCDICQRMAYHGGSE